MENCGVCLSKQCVYLQMSKIKRLCRLFRSPLTINVLILAVLNLDPNNLRRCRIDVIIADPNLTGRTPFAALIVLFEVLEEAQRTRFSHIENRLTLFNK